MSGARRRQIAVELALAGLLTVLAILSGEIVPGTLSWGVLGYLLWFAGAGTLGAGLAGLACAGLFGQPGRAGWFTASLGAVLATVLGGAIGGSLVVPGFGTVLGAIHVPLAIHAEPVIGLVWAGAMAVAHLRARRLRSAAP